MKGAPFLALILAACAAQKPIQQTTIRSPASHEATSPIVLKAAETQAHAARVARQRDDLSNAELIRMLRLSDDLRRAVSVWRAHRTASNAAAVRTATDALRGTIRK